MVSSVIPFPLSQSLVLPCGVLPVALSEVETLGAFRAEEYQGDLLLLTVHPDPLIILKEWYLIVVLIKFKKV